MDPNRRPNVVDIDPTVRIKTDLGNFAVGDFKWFRCGKCQRAFTTRAEYTVHINNAACETGAVGTIANEIPDDEEEDEDEEDDDEDEDDDTFLCRYKCMNCPAVLSSKQAFREHDCDEWLKEDKPNHAARMLVTPVNPMGSPMAEESSDTWKCEVCDLTLKHKWKYEEHLASYTHKVNLSKRGYMPMMQQNTRNFCKICNMQLEDGNKFRHHLNSLAHIMNAKKTDVTNLAAPPTLNMHCEFCDQKTFISVTEYNMHVWAHQFEELPGEGGSKKDGTASEAASKSSNDVDPAIADILCQLSVPPAQSSSDGADQTGKGLKRKHSDDDAAPKASSSKGDQYDPLSMPLEIQPFSCALCDTACSSLDEYETHMATIHPDIATEVDASNEDFEEINNIASLFTAANSGAIKTKPDPPPEPKAKQPETLDLASLGLGSGKVVVKTLPAGQQPEATTGNKGVIKKSMVVSQADLQKILSSIGGGGGKDGKPKVVVMKGGSSQSGNSTNKPASDGDAKSLDAKSLGDILKNSVQVDLDNLASSSMQEGLPGSSFSMMGGGDAAFGSPQQPYQNFEDTFNSVMMVAANFPELYRSIMEAPPDTKEFICPRCAASFTDRDQLMVHLSQHSVGRSGPGMYTCSVCKAAFKKIELYTSHMKQHVNAMGQPCPHCDRKFMHPSALESHITRNHRRPRYLEKSAMKCTLCGLSVTNTHHLQRHMMTQHAKEFIRKKKKK